MFSAVSEELHLASRCPERSRDLVASYQQHPLFGIGNIIPIYIFFWYPCVTTIHSRFTKIQQDGQHPQDQEDVLSWQVPQAHPPQGKPVQERKGVAKQPGPQTL